MLGALLTYPSTYPPTYPSTYPPTHPFTPALPFNRYIYTSPHAPKMVAAVDTPEVMKDDLTLIRFLRARDLKLDKSTAMWKDHIAWRKTYGVDAVPGWDQNRPAEGVFVEEWFPGGAHGVSHMGTDIEWIRIGEADFPGIVNQVGMDDFIKHAIAGNMRTFAYVCRV